MSSTAARIRSRICGIAVISVFVAYGILSLWSTEPAVVAEFPIESNGDLILVPVTLGDSRLQFCLDTGATITVFDESLKPHLGAPVGRSTVNNDLVVERFQWPHVRLGSLKMHCDSEVICVDLAHLRSATGHDVFGIIGMDWLQSTVFELNSDQAKIRFWSSLPAQHGSPIPLEVAEKRAFVTVNIDGLGGSEFRIDTGCQSAATLTADDVGRLKQAGRMQPLGRSYLSSYRGLFDAEVGRLQSLQLGEYNHLGLIVFEGGERLLGMGIWSRHNLFFDLPEKKLYLAPGPSRNRGR